MPNLPMSVAFMASCVFGNKIFFSGGRQASGQFILGEDDPEGIKSQVFKMVVNDTLKYKALPPMLSARSNHGMVAYRDRIWVIGGTNGVNPINEVESLTMLDKESSWQE